MFSGLTLLVIVLSVSARPVAKQGRRPSVVTSSPAVVLSGTVQGNELARYAKVIAFNKQSGNVLGQVLADANGQFRLLVSPSADAVQIECHCHVQGVFKTIVLDSVTKDLTSLVCGPDVDHIQNEPSTVEFYFRVLNNVEYGVKSNATAVSLKQLDYVGGDVSVDQATMVQTVDMSALTYVGNDFRASGNNALTRIDIGAVTYVGNDLAILFNTGLISSHFSKVAHVGGALSFLYNTALPQILLPSLTYIGNGFEVMNNAILTQLDLPTLEFVGGDFRVSSNAMLGSLHIPSLITVQGDHINKDSVFMICQNGNSFETPATLRILFPHRSCQVSSGSAPCPRATICAA